MAFKEAGPNGMTLESPTISIVRRMIENAFEAILGPNAHRVLMYHLSRRLHDEPYNILLEEPSRFYAALKEIFGVGADTLILNLGDILIVKYSVNISRGQISKLMPDGNGEEKQILLRRLEQATRLAAHHRPLK
ncbi:MAG: hypothetical protein NXY59_01245 [Aigarchaeota archaeon]|nr:hypothetical protein [Candidatus Pelearchaeum maunauluense]